MVGWSIPKKTCRRTTATLLAVPRFCGFCGFFDQSVGVCAYIHTYTHIPVTGKKTRKTRRFPCIPHRPWLVRSEVFFWVRRPKCTCVLYASKTCSSAGFFCQNPLKPAPFCHGSCAHRSPLVRASLSVLRVLRVSGVAPDAKRLCTSCCTLSFRAARSNTFVRL